jgi:GT2 family glycosyltransferase/glycosyltransferase involved in cell wall biosynthesis
MPRASIVIPIYEMAGLLTACLASLEADGLDDIELILVDNASTESRMTTLLRDWDDRAVVLRNAVNTGFATGCNQGAAAATAPVVVFLNSDTEVRPGWIEPLIESASEPGAGMVGARLLYPDGRVQHAGMALSDGMQPLHLHQRVPGDHPAVTRTRELQLVTGACCAIDRALFAEHRGFDTDYTNGYEDVDLCLRLIRDGRRNIYRGDSVVVHHESMSPGRADLESQNAVLFRTRWQGWRSDFAELLAEDGIDDAGADCRWEGPLFDASPEAAFGRAAVHALVEEGRVPFAYEPDPRPLAEAAGALCDDVLLAALNRRRIGVPAADTFRHLTGGRTLGLAPNWGAVIAVVSPGCAVPADIVNAPLTLAAGTPALQAVAAAGVRASAIASLDPLHPNPESARRAVLGPATVREGLGWYGPLVGRSGYAGAGRGLLQAAEVAGVPLLAYMGDQAEEGLEPPDLHVPAQDFVPGIVVSHAPPVLPNGTRVWERTSIGLGLPVIGATCFETQGLPTSWVEACNSVREVWVPSSFNLRTFADAGVDPERLHVVPYPVDTRRLRHEPRERDPEAPVSFLSIFEWTWRKGWDVLLQAWAEEFAHDERVRLTVVTYRGHGAAGEGSVVDQAVGHLQSLGHDPERIADLQLVLEPVAFKEMPDLYRSADALVLPSRGEGAGMPVLEAAACGVPVIATDWGGYEELMDESTAFPVALDGMVEASEALLVDNTLYRGLLLAEPSVASLRARMRAVVDDPAGAAARGLAGRALVEERFSIAAAAAAFDARAHALLDRPGSRVAR